MEHILEPTSDTAWVVDTKGYDPLREGSVESRFAISNGFLGVQRRPSGDARCTLADSGADLCGRLVRYARG